MIDESNFLYSSREIVFYFVQIKTNNFWNEQSQYLLINIDLKIQKRIGKCNI